MIRAKLIHTLKSFTQAVNSDDKDRVFELVKEHKMISQRRQHCPRNHPMRIVPMKRNIDGYVWRCSARGCQATRSIRTNTFFQESKLK
jgi:hypothetical protein